MIVSETDAGTLHLRAPAGFFDLAGQLLQTRDAAEIVSAISRLTVAEAATIERLIILGRNGLAARLLGRYLHRPHLVAA